jgi:F0F1-type ATP synthase assembly protein I
MKADPNADGGRETNSTESTAGFALVFEIGIRLALSVVIGLGLGVLADGWLHTGPGLTLVGMLLGIAAAMYTIWDVAQKGRRR